MDKRLVFSRDGGPGAGQERQRARWVGRLLVLLLAGYEFGLSFAVAQTPAGPLSAPKGRFLQPVTQAGKPVDYELRYEHAPGLEVIFPDSLASFAPFEYESRTWYPTRTQGGRSLDRTIYHLRTFSLDSVQRLVLPVLILREADTLRLATAPAQVRLHRVAPTDFGPTSTPLPLRQNLDLVPIDPTFDYPFWLALAVAVLAIGAGSAALFRGRLQRRYYAYKRRKNHQYFLAQFARHVERFSLSQSANNVERAVSLWKNYLSGLDASPLTSFTSREIVAYFKEDPDVKEALDTTDRVVYGNQQIEDEEALTRAFNLLRGFAERRYAAIVAD